MKIQYCSDLHLEFPANRRFIAKNPLQPTGDILLLAGDIVSFKVIDKASDFFDFVSDHFSEVYWVPGNHEYYGSDIKDKPTPLCERVRRNVHLVNDQVLTRNGWRFIFTTMWSPISPLHEREIESCISDFSAIGYQGQKLTASRFTRLHEESLDFLRDELQAVKQIPTMVVTHHVPTLTNYPPQYRNSSLNGAFAVELFDLIHDCGPTAWIYGHHHVNTPDFTIGQTKLMTNQLGYVHSNEHGTFRRDATIEYKRVF